MKVTEAGGRQRGIHPARRWDAEVRADLARESEVDLTMAWNRRRALGIEALETVVAALAQQSSAVGT